MGLFASNKTVKIYFDEKGKVTDKETPDWVEVYSELTVSAAKKLQQAWGKARLEYKDGQQVFVFDNLENVPMEFLAEVIVKWSEKDAVTLENIRAKLRYDVAQELYNKLSEIYGLR
ncbi:MAG: hypothetical protein WBH60_03865 [Fervidobacterium sp.]